MQAEVIRLLQQVRQQPLPQRRVALVQQAALLAHGRGCHRRGAAIEQAVCEVKQQEHAVLVLSWRLARQQGVQPAARGRAGQGGAATATMH